MSERGGWVGCSKSHTCITLSLRSSLNLFHWSRSAVNMSIFDSSTRHTHRHKFFHSHSWWRLIARRRLPGGTSSSTQCEMSALWQTLNQFFLAERNWIKCLCLINYFWGTATTKKFNIHSMSVMFYHHREQSVFFGSNRSPFILLSYHWG